MDKTELPSAVRSFLAENFGEKNIRARLLPIPHDPQKFIVEINLIYQDPSTPLVDGGLSLQAMNEALHNSFIRGHFDMSMSSESASSQSSVLQISVAELSVNLDSARRNVREAMANKKAALFSPRGNASPTFPASSERRPEKGAVVSAASSAPHDPANAANAPIVLKQKTSAFPAHSVLNFSGAAQPAKRLSAEREAAHDFLSATFGLSNVREGIYETKTRNPCFVVFLPGKQAPKKCGMALSDVEAALNSAGINCMSETVHLPPVHAGRQSSEQKVLLILASHLCEHLDAAKQVFAPERRSALATASAHAVAAAPPPEPAPSNRIADPSNVVHCDFTNRPSRTK